MIFTACFRPSWGRWRCSLESRPWGNAAGLGLAFALALSVLACSCQQAPHLAEGSWSGDHLRIVIFPDGTATVNSVACTWVPADYWSVRLELVGPSTVDLPFSLASEFRVLEGSEANRATLNVLWGDVVLERLHSAGQSGF